MRSFKVVLFLITFFYYNAFFDYTIIVFGNVGIVTAVWGGI